MHKKRSSVAMKRILKSSLIISALLGVFLAGMVCQRFYGLGNLVSLATLSTDDTQTIDLESRQVHVFLLAGQSNMEGAGDITKYSPPPEAIRRRIFVFSKDYTLVSAKEPISKAGVGPSVAFAAEYLRRIDDPNIDIVLVPAARGGTNISEWMPAAVDGNLYTEAVKRTLAASHLGEIRGVLFFQGENDAEGDPEDHPGDWDTLFSDLITALRAEFRSPNLPVVFAQIGAGDGDNWNAVKNAQKRVRIENVIMIKTDDLPYGEGCHFTTSAYVEIGHRFAESMDELQAQKENATEQKNAPESRSRAF